MKKICFFILMTVFTATSFAQFPNQPNISVTGKAIREVIPDIIVLSIQLNDSEGNKKMSVQQKELTLIRILSDLSVPSSSLKLLDALSNFNTSWWKADKLQTVKQFELNLSNIEQLSQVLEELRKVELGTINISKLDYSKRLEVQKEVSIQALNAAKEKATYLAEAVGQTIGKALYINEESGVPFSSSRFTLGATNSYANRYFSDLDSALDGSINFKQIEIKAEVSAIFEIL